MAGRIKNIPRDKLWPTHLQLVEILDQLNIAFVTRDDEENVFISYRDGRMDAVYVPRISAQDSGSGGSQEG